MSYVVMFHWIMIQIFIAHTASEAVVRGVIGQPVQLPCFYQVARQKDISDICWGRGPCPNSKCSNEILHTTGNRVTFRKSQRYNLQGYISYGDVSLTIGKVKAEDAGTYCCRVEIPGWFNDIKQNMRLEVDRAPPVMITTTRKAPISPKHFRKTTFAPQGTSDHQATAETASPAVITLETIATPTFAVTTNDTFPETMVTTSALPDFSTGFQAADTRTEDDDMFCSGESVSLPRVTTEFLSTFPTAEGTGSADTSLVVEDLPTAATTPPAPTMLRTPKRTLAPSGTSASSDGKAEKHDNGDQFPSYAILIACLIAVPILFVVMLSLFFWKRKHTKKFIIKSLGPAGDLQKVFSGAEGENSIFSL
ncbi:TIMD4 protein, partial [Nyctibius grandis]|nr:TIMD4 protein [Nyctibius grandis]